MRWERLFDDLEAQLDAASSAELAAEVADRSRREAARLRLVDRLRGNEGARLQVSLAVRAAEGAGPAGDAVAESGSGHGSVVGRLDRVGADWLLLDGTGGEVLVPLGAVVCVSGLGPGSAEPGSEGAVGARLGLGHVLRALARDRAEVNLLLIDGSRRTGRIDRVGADHVELAAYDPGEPRRVVATLTVPFVGLACVRATTYG
jgi:hypothetical protein